MEQRNDEVAARFVGWFGKYGTQHAAIGITQFPGMGRGAIALQDIDQDTVLFSIPRTLLLNTTNSRLLSLLSEEDRKTLRGWTPLILSMMWEYLESDSLWRPYFDVMPKNFDSLMFWSESELKELEGCAVLGKIGKEEATKDYFDILQPLIAKHNDIFGDASQYSEELYNQMGSLILSRSFHVEEPEDEDEGDSSHMERGLENDGNADAETSTTSLLEAAEGMDIHNDTGILEASGKHNEDNGEDGDDEDDDDDDDEDEESVANIAMVPWADMLNASYGRDNARLFYEKECLNMTTTKPIKKGEQIWNVYGDPPNSDLLRRYGHVDQHNPADVAEITADLVADVACKSMADRDERIETLLEAELDDTYTFTLNDHDEDVVEVLAAIAVFQADKATLSKIQKKGKVPREGLKEDKRLLKLAKAVFQKRLEQYPHNYEEDERNLQTTDSINPRLRYAIIVRHSEMAILHKLIKELDSLLPTDIQNPGNSHQEERATNSQDDGTGSKSKILSKKEMREDKKRQREEEKLLNGAADRRKRRA